MSNLEGYRASEEDLSHEEEFLRRQEEVLEEWASAEGLVLDPQNRARILAADRAQAFLDATCSASEAKLMGRLIAYRCHDRITRFADLALKRASLDDPQVRQAFIHALGAYQVLDDLHADIQDGAQAQKIMREMQNE